MAAIRNFMAEENEALKRQNKRLEQDNRLLRAALIELKEYAAAAIFGGWRHRVHGIAKRALDRK